MVSMSTPGLLGHIVSKGEAPRPDCLIWPGAVDRGYGRIYVDGSARRVHRVVWELTNGPIPEGLTIDHLCRIRSCMNVDHMELVTQGENTRRALPFRKQPLEPRRPSRSTAPRVPRTHCQRGHEYTEENTRVRASGKRECRACIRAARERNREHELELRRQRRAARRLAST